MKQDRQADHRLAKGRVGIGGNRKLEFSIWEQSYIHGYEYINRKRPDDERTEVEVERRGSTIEILPW